METLVLKDGTVIDVVTLEDTHLRTFLESEATSAYSKDFDSCSQEEQLEVIDTVKKELTKIG
jgi:hypothetical protein